MKDRIGLDHDTVLGPVRVQLMPDLFSDERHQGMQEPQHRVEHRRQDPSGPFLFCCIHALQSELAQLQIPVTELMPGELVEQGSSFIEAVVVERLPHFTNGVVQAR